MPIKGFPHKKLFENNSRTTMYFKIRFIRIFNTKRIDLPGYLIQQE